MAIVLEACARFVDFAHMASSAAAADNDVYSANEGNIGGLGHMNGLLVGDAPSSTLRAQVVPGPDVAQARDEVVDGEV